MKEVVIKHHRAANLHACVVVCDQICDIGSKLMQKLVPTQRVVTIMGSRGKTQLVIFYAYVWA